ncbi:MAG TPA: O-antigen ligase family protein [Thermoleophilaceae bacterium]|nr:O-antigen ligase family protein [Thermoleophilaceae bacterium]
MRALREPLTIVLGLLALLALASIMWTIGPEERTARWAAVTLGYAGVFVAATVAGRAPGGRRALAAGIALIAAVAAAIGAAAVILEERPYALFLGGEWRPAGPLEYPPALALLVVAALPVFIDAARSRAQPLRAAGTLALALAAVVLVLSQSRLALAFGLGVAALALFRLTRQRAVLGVGALMAVTAGSVAFGQGDGPASGFLHGREDTWEAGIESFLDRPLEGAGADAFLAASARHQDGAAILFAHDLPLELAVELGVAGLLLALALYVATGRIVWEARASHAAWLFGPGVVAFLVANLLDWPWHLAGMGAIWAVGCGALAGTRASFANRAGTEPSGQGDP